MKAEIILKQTGKLIEGIANMSLIARQYSAYSKDNSASKDSFGPFILMRITNMLENLQAVGSSMKGDDHVALGYAIDNAIMVWGTEQRELTKLLPKDACIVNDCFDSLLELKRSIQ